MLRRIEIQIYSQEYRRENFQLCIRKSMLREDDPAVCWSKISFSKAQNKAFGCYGRKLNIDVFVTQLHSLIHYGMLEVLHNYYLIAIQHYKL